MMPPSSEIPNLKSEMNLAFSTNAFTKHPLIDALRGIKRAGFAGVEILADTPHAYPDAIDAALTTEVKRELDKLQLAVSNINVNCSFGYWKDAPPEPYFDPSLIPPNPKHREDRTRLIMKALDFAKDVSAANISITSGRLLGGMPPEPAAKQFAQSIRPILDRADQLNVNVGIECEPGLYLEYVAELRDWIDRLAPRGPARKGFTPTLSRSSAFRRGGRRCLRRRRRRPW